VVGTVMGGYDGHRGWIYSLAVDPTHRRQNVGTTLVQRVEHALEELGCPKINLQILIFERGNRRVLQEARIPCRRADQHGQGSEISFVATASLPSGRPEETRRCSAKSTT
jgi:GNAT superfamily N-acetyltransferase